MKINVQCWRCNHEYTVTCKRVDFNRWQRGELIQVALGYLTDGERELLLSKTCDSCWTKMFGEPLEQETEN